MTTGATFAVRYAPLTFAAGEHKRLRQHLSEVFRYTQILPVGGAADLRLDPRTARLVRGGHVLAADALRQICAGLAPGLYGALAHISGLRHPGHGGTPISVAAAVDMYNRAVALRADACLANRSRMVLDLKARRLDGLIGAKYSYIDNLTFDEHAREVLRASPFTVRFSHGLLLGRHMTLMYLGEAPVFTVTAAGGCDAYYAGYWFANGETSGASKACAGVCLYRNDIGARALGVPTRLPGVKHVGADFRERLTQLFEGVVAKAAELANMRDRVQALPAQRLGFSGKAADDRQVQQRWITRLVRAGLPTGIAKEIATTTMYYGAHDDLSKTPAPLSAAALSRRSLYDLATVLMYRARQLGAANGGRLERVAYSIMSGRLTVGDQK